jgi:uncharacterized protein (TIGR03437 family)
VTGPRPMMRMIRFVVLTWMAVGLVPGPRPCQAQAVVIGAGYATPGTIDVAPGQVITIFARVPGKIPADTVSATPPLPFKLAGFSVVLRQTFPSDPKQIPLLSVADYQSCSVVAPLVCDTVSMITVQVPFELTPNVNTVPKTTVPQNFARLEISYNDAPTNSLFVNPVPDRIHILNSCDVAAAPLRQQETCLPLITRADGTVVSPDNAPQPGEVLSVSVVGLGPANTPVATGVAAPQDPVAVDGVLIGLDARANASPGMPLAVSSFPANSALLKSGLVGIYQVTFTVPSLPSGTPACSDMVRSNLTINIGRTASYDGVGICVDTSGTPATPSSGRRHVPPAKM